MAILNANSKFNNAVEYGQVNPIYYPSLTPYSPSRRVQPKAEQNVTRRISEAGKRKIFFIVSLLGIMAIVVVIFSAFAANLSYTNSLVRDENKQIIAEIEALDIEMRTTHNIKKIESKSIDELGMIAPNVENIVTIGKNKEDLGLAKKMKSIAFE